MNYVEHSWHGTYIGYKYRLEFNELSEEDQEKERMWVADLAFDLWDNETKYAAELYSEIGWVEKVEAFLQYNLNKAMDNLGLPQLFETTAADVDPIVMNGISTTTSNHDFFSQVGNGYLLGNVETVTKDDFDLLEKI